jgi:hypothetical protein
LHPLRQLARSAASHCARSHAGCGNGCRCSSIQARSRISTLATAERASPEMLGLGRRRTADLFAHAAPARSRFVHRHDRGHLYLSKKSGPGFPRPDPIWRATYIRPRCHRGFILSRSEPLSNRRPSRFHPGWFFFGLCRTARRTVDFDVVAFRPDVLRRGCRNRQSETRSPSLLEASLNVNRNRVHRPSSLALDRPV